MFDEQLVCSGQIRSFINHKICFHNAYIVNNPLHYRWHASLEVFNDSFLRDFRLVVDFEGWYLRLLYPYHCLK